MATLTVGTVGGAAPVRTLGRCGWPLLLGLVVLGAVSGAAAARLPGGGARLAPGPSVEDDNPLPNKVANSRRCAALPARVLRQVLGPAYNPAYMAFSLDEPGAAGAAGAASSDGGFSLFQMGELDDTHHSSRVLKESPWTPAGTANEVSSSFSVDEHYREVLSDEPAWMVRYDMPTVMLSGSHRTSAGRRQAEQPEEQQGGRAARAVRPALPFNSDLQWHCESPLRWLDLGPDSFPRYLRSADCSHHSCTGDNFVCKPRSFTVKVLRRREGVCAPAPAPDLSASGLPHDLRDLWIWELRAVNFCCVCRVRK